MLESVSLGLPEFCHLLPGKCKGPGAEAGAAKEQ